MRACVTRVVCVQGHVTEAGHHQHTNSADTQTQHTNSNTQQPTPKNQQTIKKGVAHRDIKLENTLLQQISGLPRPLVKICDLGYAKHDNRSAAHSKVAFLGGGMLVGSLVHTRTCHTCLPQNAKITNNNTNTTQNTQPNKGRHAHVHGARGAQQPQHGRRVRRQGGRGSVVVCAWGVWAFWWFYRCFEGHAHSTKGTQQLT